MAEREVIQGSCDAEHTGEGGSADPGYHFPVGVSAKRQRNCGLLSRDVM